MNDASDTKPFELGPFSRAEIAEEALRDIVEGKIDCSCEVCIREFANSVLARISTT